LHRRALKRETGSMARLIGAVALACGLAWSAAASVADDTSPAGLWRTIDDRTGQPRSLVRIYEEGGRFFGRIEKGLNPQQEALTCAKCTDERRDKPLLGMVILRNLKAEGGAYVDGDVLDPDNGTVYRCKLKLEEGGRKLVLRGFVGVAMFGRSQTWEREQ
jgi:uncharacterized protein (DUF2147 family)